jgi:XTP/dITP diphosphohydrolase
VIAVVLATHNPGKVAEYARLLGDLPVEIRSLAEHPGYEAPPEDGETFDDNARIKALAAARATGMPAIADDSGLCVDALGGAPGVRSARYGGPGKSDADRCEHLLDALAGVPAEERKAHFACVIAVALPGGQADTVGGRCDGHIRAGARGGGGFGYDPLFVPEGETLTFAELPPAHKDRISHRGDAAVGLPRLLSRILDLAKGGDLL